MRVDFDRRLRLDFHGSRSTSDAGLPANRELDHGIGLTGTAVSILTEARRGKNIRHLVEGLFRSSVCGRLAVYVDRRGLDGNAGSSMTKLRDKLNKIAPMRSGTVSNHVPACRKIAIPRRLFAEIPRLIDGLGPKAAPT